MDPFTYEFSKKAYPVAVHSTGQFIFINRVLNHSWSVIFALSFLLSIISYSEDMVTQQIWMNLLPLALQLGIGLPLTLKLPIYLMGQGTSGKNNFPSCKEAMEAMPYGLNKMKAQGVEAIVQFHFTGEEEFNGFLVIENQECRFTEGVHPAPKTTIKVPSEIWLKVTNGQLSGAEAYLNGHYLVEGDQTILLKIEDLFQKSPDSHAPASSSQETTGSLSQNYQFKGLQPKKIREVLVIDSGGRSTQYSKSSLMAGKFCEGLRSVGANVEYVFLREKKIDYCKGCFTCWTKTPGKCVSQKDDMPGILKRLREVDLVVYVSPLFVFSVNARMKAFLDKIVPNMLPYMVMQEGVTTHPPRFPEDGETGMVVFSAGGFPEVKGNFDGISAIFRSFSHHSDQMKLMAEFFLPAAESLSMGIFKERRDRVEQCCFEAGVQAVEQGKINLSFMQSVADSGVSIEEFHTQANTFWKTVDGKKHFYKGTQKLFPGKKNRAI